MPVSSRPNTVHPTRDTAVLVEPWTSEELRALALHHPKPLAHKAVPGTELHRKLLEAGARRYQQCPPLELSADRPEAKRWAEEHAMLQVEQMRG